MAFKGARDPKIAMARAYQASYWVQGPTRNRFTSGDS